MSAEATGSENLDVAEYVGVDDDDETAKRRGWRTGNHRAFCTSSGLNPSQETARKTGTGTCFERENSVSLPTSVSLVGLTRTQDRLPRRRAAPSDPTIPPVRIPKDTQIINPQARAEKKRFRARRSAASMALSWSKRTWTRMGIES